MGSLVLPDDIWQCIASFLPSSSIAPLISVNRAWYNIVLDARYQEIHWDKVDAAMTRTLVRLRTPSIAARVRRLHIRAWFIEYLVNKEALAAPSYVGTSRRWVARHFRLPSTPPRVAPSASGKSSAAADILASMTHAVRLMTQVTAYSFEWRDLAPTPGTLRFLTAARTAFGASLRTLTLHAQLDNFARLLSTVDFDNLEELELSFDHDARTPSPDATAALLQDTIAPFVNHFRRSIGSLVIARFPHLHRLTARFAFDAAHLADPAGLVRVLRANAETLARVEVGWAFAATADDDTPLSTWPAFSRAVVAPDDDSGMAVPLAGLEALKIPALTTFDGTLACLRRSANTHFLSHEELAALVGVFAHRQGYEGGLEELYAGVRSLTVATLDLLAGRLPGLRDLSLVLAPSTVADVVHRDSVPSDFCVGLTAHVYSDWALQNVGIWEKRFIETQISSSEETAIMEHIARCVPSVKTFKGGRKTVGVVCRYMS
ncbi:hypothetical protein C8R46DRAFT_1058587 [Mycena filopes]|nr:hypothetical protein C8R46DRAFT_1058587 [Mycena filopes]